ncbi:hypothetical protein [Halorussus sp. MSC15.2]|uniref:hypothetical protein n=1 Tax=Halorussus sp. MSC15.2 TaxID=2283638 RepID=UPI0013D4DA3B|nr:hypothetical protein [Halorussus sp. MSC15.2]NEU57635.1 hypothetical protein [Halorussus sp. MSC15.2]
MGLFSRDSDDTDDTDDVLAEALVGEAEGETVTEAALTNARRRKWLRNRSYLSEPVLSHLDDERLHHVYFDPKSGYRRGDATESPYRKRGACFAFTGRRLLLIVGKKREDERLEIDYEDVSGVDVDSEAGELTLRLDDGAPVTFAPKTGPSDPETLSERDWVVLAEFLDEYAGAPVPASDSELADAASRRHRARGLTESVEGPATVELMETYLGRYPRGDGEDERPVRVAPFDDLRRRDFDAFDEVRTDREGVLVVSRTRLLLDVERERLRPEGVWVEQIRQAAGLSKKRGYDDEDFLDRGTDMLEIDYRSVETTFTRDLDPVETEIRFADLASDGAAADGRWLVLRERNDDPLRIRTESEAMALALSKFVAKYGPQ